jgi:hypothetical protein
MESPLARLRAHAVSRQPRSVIAMLVSDAVHLAGGWVAETIVFGDEQVVVRFEIAMTKFDTLRAALRADGIFATEWVAEPATVSAEADAAIAVALIGP